jgi:hypothetical protein
MAIDSCVTRIANSIKKSSITAVEKQELINQIKTAVAQAKKAKLKAKLDKIDIDKIGTDITEQIKIEKKINKINAVNDEILMRENVENILKNFKNDEAEGLIALMVGSNTLTLGARSSVASAQNAAQGILIADFNDEIDASGLFEMFDKADTKLQNELANTQEQISKGIEITNQNPDVVKLATIMEKHSELTRQKLNARGANIPKMWGYVVKQSNDQFNVRAAANRLGKNLDQIEVSKDFTGTDINFNKNYNAWKDYVMKHLDQDETFVNTDSPELFLSHSYNSLVGNKLQLADGASTVFGSKSMGGGKTNKRVLHFKSANDWFQYNEKFGTGSLKETYYSGLMTAGRNIGMLDVLGSRPKENFEKIRVAIGNRLQAQQRSTESIKSAKQFEKYMNVIDGTVYTFDGGQYGFAVAKWSAISRAFINTTKLGGAVISAAADIGIYGSEMKFQGRSFLGGMGEAMSGLARLKNTKQKQRIARSSGLMADGVIYDVSGRFQVGDNLTKGWTQIQRTFFKYNLLSWWTNTLKENAMLGMANYYASQKNLNFKQLNKPLQDFFSLYNIDSNKWDIIRKSAMTKADDGMEFINISSLDQIVDGKPVVSDADIKKITGLDDLTAQEMQMEREKFKYSISGMLLDRSIYAVIEPDARVKGFMTQGSQTGTVPGEAIRFVGQFKSFPVAVAMKVLGREIGFIKRGKKLGGFSTESGRADYGRGARGMASIMLTTAFMGYISMTAKDLLRGKEPRDPNKKATIMAALLQGGGLGIYGDVLFKEHRDANAVIGGLAGPGLTTAVDIGLAFKYAAGLDGSKTAKKAHQIISQNVPFLNLFYAKAAFDYMIGFQIMETMNPGALKRIEKRMKKEYNQEYQENFLFTKPSRTNKGF